MAKNQVCHIEFNVTDIARSQKFYETLFGWQFRQFTDSMVVFGAGTEHIGGLFKVDQVEPGGSPSVWFEVDDIEKQFEVAKSAGGTTNGEKTQVPDVGWSGTVNDPDGNRVGLVQFVRE